jgi:hypothetical protein
MMPLRERIVRKAKDRAVETLHELTTKSPPNSKSTSDTSAVSATADKANNRSYRPFAEQPHHSENDESDNETESGTPKRGGGARQPRRKNTTVAKGRARPSTARTINPGETNGLAAEPLTDSTTNSLFNQVYQGQVSLQTIVDDLIELYKKDRDTAMLDLIKFIVRCSGCKAAHLLTNRRDVLKSKEFTDVINELIENFNDDDETQQAQAEAYPLVQTSVQARRFTRNFCEFLQLLINQCQYSIIYDQFMLDVLINFLIGLADSQVRAFRHTATLAVLKVNEKITISFLFYYFLHN